jgi:hypothetical protein
MAYIFDISSGIGVHDRPPMSLFPPFHGGNTGSIPVGRASDFNGLAGASKSIFNKCSISLPLLASALAGCARDAETPSVAPSSTTPSANHTARSRASPRTCNAAHSSTRRAPELKAAAMSGGAARAGGSDAISADRLSCRATPGAVLTTGRLAGRSPAGAACRRPGGLPPGGLRLDSECRAHILLLMSDVKRELRRRRADRCAKRGENRAGRKRVGE